METLMSRTEDMPADKEIVDPVADRRYIIDCAIRTGIQGAPFEEEVIEDSLKYLFESEKEGHVHRWFSLENAQAMLQQIKDNANNNISREALAEDEELAHQLKEDTGKSIEESMDTLKKILGLSQELCDNIVKIRNWLDDGTDMLIEEYAKEDPIKKAEVIVGLATLSGFLSDYFSIMGALMEQEDEDEENPEDEDNEREEEVSKPKKLDPRTFGKSKQAKVAPSERAEGEKPPTTTTNFFAAASDDNKQTTFGFGASNVEYDVPEGDEVDADEEEAEEEGEDDLYGDDDFDDEEEMAQLCFTMSQIAHDDPLFMKTLEVGLSVTSLIIKDFEQWVGVEFVVENDEEDEDCPDLVNVQ